MTSTQIMLIIRGAAVIIEMAKAKDVEIDADDITLIASAFNIDLKAENEQDSRSLATVIEAICGIFNK